MIPFINKYKQEGTNVPLEKKMIGKKIQKNTVTIAVNVLYAKEIYIPCLCSKYNLNHGKQVIIFLIPTEDGRHFLQ